MYSICGSGGRKIQYVRVCTFCDLLTLGMKMIHVSIDRKQMAMVYPLWFLLVCCLRFSAICQKVYYTLLMFFFAFAACLSSRTHKHLLLFLFPTLFFRVVVLVPLNRRSRIYSVDCFPLFFSLFPPFTSTFSSSSSLLSPVDPSPFLCPCLRLVLCLHSFTLFLFCCIHFSHQLFSHQPYRNTGGILKHGQLTHKHTEVLLFFNPSLKYTFVSSTHPRPTNHTPTNQPGQPANQPTRPTSQSTNQPTNRASDDVLL
ncbi:hypothetical protein BKA57DRAFT_132083 [Linnemannia elongata]|nr:hypothetical protein BKA57DRAFT_132083 [Linnemannia elongata]